MSDYVRVGSVAEFDTGVMRAFVVGGRAVAVVRLEEGFFAFDNFCTHEAVMLTSGYGAVAASSVICMLHGSIFSIESGEVISGPASEPLTTFNVRVEGEDVFVAQTPDVGSRGGVNGSS